MVRQLLFLARFEREGGGEQIGLVGDRQRAAIGVADRLAGMGERAAPPPPCLS